MPPFDFMTFSVTTVTTREQKQYSFLPEEQIVLEFSGNDFVTLNYRLTFPRFFFTLSLQSEIMFISSRICLGKKWLFFGLLRVPIMALLQQAVYLVSLIGFV